MGKSTHFFGQPSYGQLTKSLEKEKIMEISRKHNGEKYVKKFNGFIHLLTMLYAVIMRFDSLREIETAMTAETNKLHYVGIGSVPKRSTISDANSQRSEMIFGEIYNGLYEQNRSKLSSESRRKGSEEWLNRHILDDNFNLIVQRLQCYKLPFDFFITGRGWLRMPISCLSELLIKEGIL